MLLNQLEQIPRGLKKTNKKIITNTVRRWQFHTLLMQVLGLIPSVDTCRICFSHKTRTLQVNLKSISANIESYISNNKSHVGIPLQLRFKNRVRHITALSIKKTKFVLMQQKYNHVESVYIPPILTDTQKRSIDKIAHSGSAVHRSQSNAVTLYGIKCQLSSPRSLGSV